MFIQTDTINLVHNTHFILNFAFLLKRKMRQTRCLLKFARFLNIFIGDQKLKIYCWHGMGKGWGVMHIARRGGIAARCYGRDVTGSNPIGYLPWGSSPHRRWLGSRTQLPRAVWRGVSCPRWAGAPPATSPRTRLHTRGTHSQNYGRFDSGPVMGSRVGWF